MISVGKGRMTSSLHGLDRLGYTRVTMAITIRCNSASWSKSVKIALVQIVFCKRKHEVGIASNRRSARYGETLNWSSTHRPSRYGSLFLTKLVYFEIAKKIWAM